MLASVRTLPVSDVTQSHIVTLHATITELDHAAHAAKSPWARRKSLGQRVAKGKALVANATEGRDAAKLRREAAVREHADAEQALRDAEQFLAGIIDDWDKVQSEVEAEAAEEVGNDMDVERGLASTDISSWSLEDLERLAPPFSVRLSAVRAERAASLLPLRVEIFTPSRTPDRCRQRPSSGTPELVSDSPGMSHSPRNRRSSRRRSASCSPPRGAASGASPLDAPTGAEPVAAPDPLGKPKPVQGRLCALTRLADLLSLPRPLQVRPPPQVRCLTPSTPRRLFAGALLAGTASSEPT